MATHDVACVYQAWHRALCIGIAHLPNVCMYHAINQNKAEVWIVVIVGKVQLHQTAVCMAEDY